MALMGLTKNEMTKLEKHRLNRRKLRVDALRDSSCLKVVTINKLQTMPKKLRPISRRTRTTHSVLMWSVVILLILYLCAVISLTVDPRSSARQQSAALLFILRDKWHHTQTLEECPNPIGSSVCGPPLQQQQSIMEHGSYITGGCHKASKDVERGLLHFRVTSIVSNFSVY
jgi:hypothetical protein